MKQNQPLDLLHRVVFWGKLKGVRLISSIISVGA